MIDTPGQLSDLIQALKQAGSIAVDTEADSLHAYPEKVCLIQISLPDSHDLVDPLSSVPLEPFFEELKRHTLIIHGADYDLRLLHRTYQFKPAVIFETMLAARLLGFQSFGLSTLVEQLLGVHLEKGSQKANWARRPLTSKMEEYARNDTRYLHKLQEILTDRLVEKGRWEWHQSMCERLIEECARPALADPNLVWRLKGSDRLDPASLAVLRELWHWRQKEAVAANLPPFFVLAHEALVELATAAAHSKDLHLPTRLSPRRRNSLMEAIDRGLKTPPSERPPLLASARVRPSEAEQQRAKQFQQRRDQNAMKLGIDPTVIAPRATLLRLAQDWEQHQKDLMHWQRELLLKAR